jgi:hypothetical protein
MNDPVKILPTGVTDMAMTELEVKNSKPAKKTFRLPDGRGLYLDIRPTCRRIWRMRYKIKEKENTLTFGEYPLISLKEARQKRDEARRLLLSNIDPTVQEELEREKSNAPTFRCALRKSPQVMARVAIVVFNIILYALCRLHAAQAAVLSRKLSNRR